MGRGCRAAPGLAQQIRRVISAAEMEYALTEPFVPFTDPANLGG